MLLINPIKQGIISYHLSHAYHSLSTGSGELFRKDIVKITGKDQGQVSRGIKTLIEKGRLAETTARAIYIPSKCT